MSRDILTHLAYTVDYDSLYRAYRVHVYDRRTLEVYLNTIVPSHDKDFVMCPDEWVEAWIYNNVKEAWPTCESTLNMELTSRRTITSSCGRLTVTESPSLTVTCSRTS
ncbi:hypothetical protein vBKpPFBKp16_025 [Klebsiella phage vB_KpP_FBKp16]|uniref:Uncharacterized protein n=1 Tax=Klebsiella phage vB_KpP_FBKp16 TaxID=2801836 RepID=A0A7U0J6S7_9CAUD|nr:hypothetical protein vBKpPFBKp16_025 [Klebsiella phage vB_KpP_FBKp16]